MLHIGPYVTFQRLLPPRVRLALVLLILIVGAGISITQASGQIDFNRDIRPILSDNCVLCHGPDPEERKGGIDGLRLDTREGALADLGGHAAIVPGDPSKSELYLRITTANEDDLMPPPKSGKKLSEREISLLKAWIEQGADYARHWAYVNPARPVLPEVRDKSWPVNAIDRFILARLEREGLAPSPEADRAALIRRVSLDLTGLPPTIEEVRQFEEDRRPGAYERAVDRLLGKKAFGEHWTRLWLDQARYADSAGYADDPPRTIWAYRDYLIRAFNENRPFDQFTIEQIAGDLLPNPTEEQLVATAFHRNTPTNNEGGTSDEEFRNVAVVDRVNTTMMAWMGTTMACAQCHTHKYDPFTQEEYFRLFALFNNTADADRKDEAPFLTIYTDEQKRQRAAREAEIAALEKTVATPTPALLAAQREWEKDLQADLTWQPLRPVTMKSKSGAELRASDDGAIRASKPGETDVYTIEFPVESALELQALRLEALPDDALPARGPGYAAGNFIVTRVLASVVPPGSAAISGRYLRVEIPGKDKILSLAEVQVFSGAENIATTGEATQSSTGFNGPAKLAIDGNTDGDYNRAKSTTHTAISENPWWELDLKSAKMVERVVVWNRTDGNVGSRLAGARLALLDAERRPVWETVLSNAPATRAEFSLGGPQSIRFAAAHADHVQEGFSAASVLNEKEGKAKGWAVGPRFGRVHQLIIIPERPVAIPVGSRLTVVIEQLSAKKNHTLGNFRVSTSTDARAAEHARTPANVLEIVRMPVEKRTGDQEALVTRHYLSVAPALAAERDRLAGLKKQLQDMAPYTTVPVMRELTGGQARMTRIHLRGNYQDLGDEVSGGLPAALHPLPEGAPKDRLGLAQWLVDAENPLTPRVIANLLWESIFGRGLVRTSEDFGSQGELPTHPELLDWLAVELRQDWDIKRFLKLLVTSAAYRQSSRVTPELLERDPDNALLARGPRFRLTAEMIRDQALFVGGLLSDKIYGPPVKPPQPELGVKAAFGSGIDWETSKGEDRHRRGLYTTWRRSNPYPSMTAFDAPNREVCTVRRERSNTPLQALVTLNDPVYMEAAQGLARRMIAAGASPSEKAAHGFRLCLSRLPRQAEIDELVRLYTEARGRFAADAASAASVATKPIGPLPEGAEAAELAAWTVVGNVLLNLDEMLMKR